MDSTAFSRQFYRGNNDPSMREVGDRRRGRCRSGAAGLDSFPPRSHSHPAPGNYAGRPFRLSDNPSSVGRRLGNYNGSAGGGALAWNHDPALPTGLHRRRDLHYPPPPPPPPLSPGMQGAIRRFQPQADLPYLRMLLEDEVAILELSIDQVRDLSETGDLSEESITNGLKTRICHKPEGAESMDEEDGCCVICQEEYQNQEKIGFLDCRHEYHADCLKKWLLRKNVCPICRAPAMASL